MLTPEQLRRLSTSPKDPNKPSENPVVTEVRLTSEQVAQLSANPKHINNDDLLASMPTAAPFNGFMPHQLGLQIPIDKPGAVVPENPDFTSATVMVTPAEAKKMKELLSKTKESPTERGSESPSRKRQKIKK